MNRALQARAFIEADPLLAREVARQLGQAAFRPDLPATKETERFRVSRKNAPTRGGMTARQRALLVFLRFYIDRHGIAPTFEEMKSGLGLASKAGIHRMITGLEERGFLTHAPRRARSIRLVSL